MQSHERNDGFPLSFAGLLASWRNPTTKDRVVSCTIVTTVANEMVSLLHDRMPVVLNDDAVERWLDPTATGLADLLPLLAPCPDEVLSAYAVSPLANKC